MFKYIEVIYSILAATHDFVCVADFSTKVFCFNFTRRKKIDIRLYDKKTSKHITESRH